MLKKLKIAPKLIVCFIIAVVIASISGIAGIIILTTTDNSYSNALVNNGFSQGDIGQFNTYLNKGGAVLRDIVLLTDKNDIQSAQNELDDIIKKTDAGLTNLKKVCQTPQEITLIDKIEQNLNLYRTSREEIIQLGLQNKNEQAMKKFQSDCRPYLNEAMTAAQELADLNVKMGEEVSASLTKSTAISRVVMLIGMIVAIIISIVFAIVVSKSISRPIIKVKEAAGQLEQGDLDIHLDSDLQDEVGDMTRSFNNAANELRTYITDIEDGLEEVAKGNFTVKSKIKYRGDFVAIQKAIYNIITSLSDTLSQINTAADQVSAGSDQVSSGAQALSQGATEQASSVEELAASINEISQHVNVNAEHAIDASDKVNTVGSEVSESNQRMQQMLSAMADISTSSSEIGKIIKTIEDIAFQTNILALNAAVEAARAGEAGKGFAVVADEVRNLAAKSAEASKNTASLIENSLKAVQSGTEIADETASALTSVVDGIHNVSETVNLISSASKEQAESITQITTGVDQISSVVQTNSATAEESAAASEELAGQSTMLKELVSRFTLRESSVSGNRTMTDEPDNSGSSSSPAQVTASKY